MIAPPRLVACPVCACHTRAEERRCPQCGAEIRGRDGAVPRTAAAVLLGLTALALQGCSSEVSDRRSASGGVGGAGGAGSSSGSSSSDSSSATSTTSVGGFGGFGGGGFGGGFTTASSTQGQGGSAPVYGVALSDADGDGYGDAKLGGSDCDDANPAVHPEAADPPGDGIDGDCDGEDG